MGNIYTVEEANRLTELKTKRFEDRLIGKLQLLSAIFDEDEPIADLSEDNLEVEGD